MISLILEYTKITNEIKLYKQPVIDLWILDLLVNLIMLLVKQSFNSSMGLHYSREK